MPYPLATRCLAAVWLFISTAIFCPELAFSQEMEQTPTRDSSLRIFAVPVVVYTPDTYWAFGAAGIVTFKGKPLRSSVSFGINYTQRKQILVNFPFQWFSPAGYWRAYGELAWYRYLYQYFGIGNSYPNDYLEKYVAQYPRARLSLLRRLRTNQLAGLRLGFDAYRILSVDEGGELAAGKVAGTGGGISSILGPVWLFDSRDNQFYPGKGVLIESTLFGESPLWGSNFSYLRFSLESSRYFTLLKNNVLALHFLGQTSAGNPPFYGMAQLGGARLLRGYPLGKYRDRHVLLVQAEYRFPIFWRFKGVVFGGTGSVFGTPGERLRWRPNAGAGLRFEFDRKQHIHLRMDYGIGAHNSGFYLTVGEAF
ncbi:MAG: BamA/TamA family outer membrane protein [Saprospiraceae bacterium]|nr:BamA/TamA family outer membrane protein [Saprospiraceae bacterium]